MMSRKRLARLWLTIRHQWFGRRHRRLVLEHVDGLPFIVLPDVFNPVLFRTGEFLAGTLAATPLSASGNGDKFTALDLGTGAGVGAVFAARRGAQVVAADLNPEAVRCAKLNALLNRFEDRIDVRHGDLFEPVAAEKFDLILFNPPFYRGQPKDAYDQAWRSEDVLERFAAGLGDHLAENGQALVVLSTDGETDAALAALEANGFTATPLASRDFVNEVITVYAVKSRP